MSATPPLDEWLALYDADDNEWWRMDAGHHLNLFDEAVGRMRAAEAALARVQEGAQEPHNRPLTAQEVDQVPVAVCEHDWALLRTDRICRDCRRIEAQR